MNKVIECFSCLGTYDLGIIMLPAYHVDLFIWDVKSMCLHENRKDRFV
jgi:hypothetical protein